MSADNAIVSSAICRHGIKGLRVAQEPNDPQGAIVCQVEAPEFPVTEPQLGSTGCRGPLVTGGMVPVGGGSRIQVEPDR